MIPPHTDPVCGRHHYRLNIIIWNAASGGKFHCSNMIFGTKRIKFFRPDINEHSVDRINNGTRYVLSIGWAIK
jgi:hypothetical protein